MYSRALAVALVLILGTTLSEVDARAISDESKDLPYPFPDKIAACINDYFRSFAPTMGKMIEEIGRSYYIEKLRSELHDLAKPVISFLSEVDKEIAKEMENDEQKKKKKKHHKEVQQEAQ